MNPSNQKRLPCPTLNLAWIFQKQRAERRTVKREKREAAARDAQKAAEAFLQVHFLP